MLFENYFSLSGIPVPSECKTFWIQIRPDVLSGLILIQTVCKGYQQTTLGGKELRNLCARCEKFCFWCLFPTMNQIFSYSWSDLTGDSWADPEVGVGGDRAQTPTPLKKLQAWAPHPLWIITGLDESYLNTSIYLINKKKI